MSFTSQKALRQSKQSQSFVNVAGDLSESNGVVARGGSESPPVVKNRPTSELVSTGGLYKTLPSSLCIKLSDSSGRGIWSKERIRCGSTLVSVKPHVTSLSAKCLESYCSSCCSSAPPSGLKRCTRCRTVWYCNPTCQNNDWRLHKHECPALQKWAAAAPSSEVTVPSDAIRCLGRLLWTKVQAGLDSDWAKELDQMESHRSSLPTSSFESHTYLAHSLVRYLGVSSPSDLESFGLASAGDLVDLTSRFTTNTITLSSPDLTPIGTAVSPLVALINHSCDPNAVVVFPHSSSDPSRDEPRMQVIALRDIGENEEVTTSYIDTTVPRGERQKVLKETYNFTCTCKLCKGPIENDPREMMWCPKSCGGGCPVPTEASNLTRCQICGTLVSSTKAVLDAVRLGQEALDKASSLQSKDPSKAYQLTSNMIPLLASAGLTISTHPLLALIRLQQSLLILQLFASTNITQDLLDETIRTAAQASSGLSNILIEGHPIRGVALTELGKLLAVDEPSPHNYTHDQDSSDQSQARFPPSGPPRLKLALNTLIRARKELLIGFGRDNDGGAVGKEVRESIMSVEKELGIWKEGIQEALQDKSRLKVIDGVKR